MTFGFVLKTRPRPATNMTCQAAWLWNTPQAKIGISQTADCKTFGPVLTGIQISIPRLCHDFCNVGLFSVSTATVW